MDDALHLPLVFGSNAQHPAVVAHAFFHIAQLAFAAHLPQGSIKCLIQFPALLLHALSDLRQFRRCIGTHIAIIVQHFIHQLLDAFVVDNVFCECCQGRVEFLLSLKEFQQQSGTHRHASDLVDGFRRQHIILNG